MIEQRVTLRYGAQQIPAIVQAVQGDTGRDVIFELADYEIPAGATANYYIDKPDGNAVYNSAEVISSTEILAHLTEQALAVPGRNNGQVRILSDDEVITSFDFVLEVEAFRGILRLQSETEINIFDQAIEDAMNTATEEAVAEIQAQTPVVTGMQNSIAPSYSASSTYAVGDYVMYNAQLYRCITAITTAEAWTEAHWTQVPLANDVNGLKQDLKYQKNVTVQQIKESIGSGTIEDEYLDLQILQTISKAYINNAPQLKINDPGITDAYKVNFYRVTSGDDLKLYGTSARLSGSFPFAAFFTNLNQTGEIIISGSSTPTNYEETYSVESDGYIAVAEVIPYNTLNVTIKCKIVDGVVKDLFTQNQYEKDGSEIEETENYPTYYINNAGSILTLGSSYTAFVVHEIPVESGKDYIIDGYVKINGDFPIAGFKATSGTSGIANILIQGSNVYTDYYQIFHAPVDGYIFIASTGYGVLSVTEAKSISTGEKILNKAVSDAYNPWYGKKVVWIGTSVSFGQYATKSYPQEIANYLGFTLVNCSVPGLSITLNDGAIKTYGSLSASKAEYTAAGITIPDAPITPYVPGGEYNGYYRTWENVFTEENADADLWVFDCVPNTYPNFGLDDWNAFNKSTWEYNDSSTFASHRNTFLGALIFLMDKLYTLNPNARMVFVLGSSFDYASGKSELQTMANQWNMGIIDLWGKVNISPKSLIKLKSENGTNAHPSTFAHEIMGKMLVGEFNRFA